MSKSTCDSSFLLQSPSRPKNVKNHFQANVTSNMHHQKTKEKGSYMHWSFGPFRGGREPINLLLPRNLEKRKIVT